jgi:hypothetical protein
MAQALVDLVLLNARPIVANRRIRLLSAEAVTADGRECDACHADAQRFCAIGALIRAAYMVTGAKPIGSAGKWQALSP